MNSNNLKYKDIIKKIFNYLQNFETNEKEYKEYNKDEFYNNIIINKDDAYEDNYGSDTNIVIRYKNDKMYLNDDDNGDNQNIFYDYYLNINNYFKYEDINFIVLFRDFILLTENYININDNKAYNQINLKLNNIISLIKKKNIPFYIDENIKNSYKSEFKSTFFSADQNKIKNINLIENDYLKILNNTYYINIYEKTKIFLKYLRILINTFFKKDKDNQSYKKFMVLVKNCEISEYKITFDNQEIFNNQKLDEIIFLKFKLMYIFFSYSNIDLNDEILKKLDLTFDKYIYLKTLYTFYFYYVSKLSFIQSKVFEFIDKPLLKIKKNFKSLIKNKLIDNNIKNSIKDLLPNIQEMTKKIYEKEDDIINGILLRSFNYITSNFQKVLYKKIILLSSLKTDNKKDYIDTFIEIFYNLLKSFYKNLSYDPVRYKYDYSYYYKFMIGEYNINDSNYKQLYDINKTYFSDLFAFIMFLSGSNVSLNQDFIVYLFNNENFIGAGDYIKYHNLIQNVIIILENMMLGNLNDDEVDNVKNYIIYLKNENNSLKDKIMYIKQNILDIDIRTNYNKDNYDYKKSISNFLFGNIPVIEEEKDIIKNFEINKSYYNYIIESVYISFYYSIYFLLYINYETDNDNLNIIKNYINNVYNIIMNNSYSDNGKKNNTINLTKIKNKMADFLNNVPSNVIIATIKDWLKDTDLSFFSIFCYFVKNINIKNFRTNINGILIYTPPNIKINNLSHLNDKSIKSNPKILILVNLNTFNNMLIRLTNSRFTYFEIKFNEVGEKLVMDKITDMIKENKKEFGEAVADIIRKVMINRIDTTAENIKKNYGSDDSMIVECLFNYIINNKMSDLYTDKLNINNIKNIDNDQKKMYEDIYNYMYYLKITNSLNYMMANDIINNIL